MKIYLKNNVLEEAKNRISYIFDEFDKVIVSYSGGKDSAVILDLTLKEAKKRNRLPLDVMFIDQEGEWTQTVENCRLVKNMEGINFKWYQMPIRIFNATSYDDQWLMCWEEGGDRLRDKEPGAITKNIYGSDRFADLFGKIVEIDYPDCRVANIGGVRAEESPKRFMALTQILTYNYITRGKVLNEDLGHFTFYPLYDWSYTDIWKYIFDNKIEYNKIYDYQFMYGVGLPNMRVSNLHHETAVNSLYYLPEIDVDLFNKLSARMAGISTANRLKDDLIPDKLPFMFSSWREYRDYLLDKLIVKLEDKKKFTGWFVSTDKKLNTLQDKKSIEDGILKSHIRSILLNDMHGATLSAAYGKISKQSKKEKMF